MNCTKFLSMSMFHVLDRERIYLFNAKHYSGAATRSVRAEHSSASLAAQWLWCPLVTPLVQLQ